MRKYVLILLLCAAGCGMAEVRSVDEALAIANSQSVKRKFGIGQSGTYHLAFVRNRIGEQVPAFYVLQRDTNMGYMLVSAETGTETVLAYSDRGRMDADNLPANVQFWLDRYARQISQIARKERQAARFLANDYTPVSPLIGTTWDQTDPYNSMCPKVGDERTATGCVATALAQIMYKHQYPTKGVGSHSYEWNSTTLSANFGATSYAWSSMLKSYASSASVLQKRAVSTLMYHLGVASEMNYGLAASGTNGVIALNGLCTYFGYDKGILSVPMDYAGVKYTQNTIIAELYEGRPVFMTGYTLHTGGHAFVCEGVDDKGYLYINWGWSGTGDGYYALSLLDPKDQGTGGSLLGEPYTENIFAHARIQPDQGGVSVPCVTTEAVALTSNKRVSKQTSIGFSMSYVANMGISTWNSYLYLVVSDADGKIVKFAMSTNKHTVESGLVYNVDVGVNGTFNTLSAGTYQLGVYVADANVSLYPIYQKGKGILQMPIEVTSDSIFIHFDEQDTDLPYTHAQCINTYQSTQWKVDLTTAAFWKSSSLGNDALIRCNMVSGSGNSLIGSYTMGSSTDVGSIGSDAQYAYGSSVRCAISTPTALELTLSADKQNRLLVDYYLAVDGKIKVGKCAIEGSEQDWWQTDGNNVAYHESPTLDVASPLTTQKMLTKAKNYTDSTYISYLVKGIIATNVSLTNNRLQFYISDNGTIRNTLQVTDARWLYGDDVPPGCPLQKGDTVVMYTKVYKKTSKYVSANGYVYSYSRSSTTPTSADEVMDTNRTAVEKVVDNGRVRIVRDGQVYDLLGTHIR